MEIFATAVAFLAIFSVMVYCHGKEHEDALRFAESLTD